mmetsp:Transcript_100507/g.174488  ORF Transcript_100507/g.174488 Transcript_100507/m.174488 type:complete len:487 (+) Transcript_100507:35-1495(+)
MASRLLGANPPSASEDYGAVEKVKLDHPGNGIYLTAGIIVADVVGAGILSMAVAIAKFGWLLGTVLAIVLLGMNVHVSIIVWRVRMSCKRVPHTYTELAIYSFEDAPPAQQRLIRLITVVMQQFLIAGFLGVYTLSLGKAFGMIFYDVHWCLPVWTLIGCLFTLPFIGSARKLGKWKSLIWLNCASILVTVIVPLWVMSQDGLDKTRIEGGTYLPVEKLSLGGVLSGLNIMIFSFTSQFMLVEIMAEMENAADFPNSYMYISAPFQAVVFLICGVGGYYFRGSLVHGIIVDNIPFGRWFQVAAAMLIIHMVITWVIKGIVVCRQMQHSFLPEHADDGSITGWINWVQLVSATMAFAYLIAQIIPFFVDLIDLLGASLTPIVCFVLPIAFYCRQLKDTIKKEDHPGYFESVAIALELLLSAVLFFVGTYLALTNIVDSWKTYGYPFDCHCQNLWRTCACSAAHPGMDHCEKEVTSFALRALMSLENR